MCRDRKRSVALVSAAANPDVIATMQTYCFGAGTELRLVPAKDGRTDLDALKAMLTPDVCCVYVQQPNFTGSLKKQKRLLNLPTQRGQIHYGRKPHCSCHYENPGRMRRRHCRWRRAAFGLPLGFGGPTLALWQQPAL